VRLSAPVLALGLWFAVSAQPQAPSPRPRPQATGQRDETKRQSVVPPEAAELASPTAALTHTPTIEGLAQPPHQGADVGKDNAPDWETRALAWANGISTVLMAAFTIIVARITRQQKDLAELAQRSTHVVERAYVDMSHAPPGVYCIDNYTMNPTPGPVNPNGMVTVRIQIRNHGATPANILAATVVAHIDTELPSDPPYTDDKDWGAYFLMPNESFWVERMIHNPLDDDDRYRRIQDGTLTLWVLGYVDYTDVFGTTHRAGYARRFYPKATDNNLVFETKPGYNYDNERRKA
jgi:hypothetical protein